MTIIVDSDWWKTLFDEVYLLTDARSVCNDSLTCREVDLIMNLLPIEPNHRILDLCGGHGRHSFEFSARGFMACTLADYSASLIECAKEQAAEENHCIEILRCDARRTGLSSESFDHVLILGNSLGYIQFPDADGHILSEAFRMLKSGGWLLVDVTDGTVVKSSFSSGSWHEIGDDTVVCRYRELHDDVVHAREMVLSKKKGLIRDRTYGIRLYDARSLSALIRSGGFAQVDVHTDFSLHQIEGDYGFMNRRMIAVAQKL
jgi:D-alanine-D-alanine ligase